MADRLARIQNFDQLDSTNAEALRHAANGELGPKWIVADVQTAGRGRSGRSWQSDPGNLFATYLTTLPADTIKAYQVALVAGVAVSSALEHLMPTSRPALRLKWPNDLLIERAKVGGILVESTKRLDGSMPVAIGIGLNLVSHPEDDARPTANLTSLGTPPSKESLIAALDQEFAAWLSRWDLGRGFALVRDEWVARAGPIGERLTIHAGREPVSGLYEGLDPDGALMLHRDDGTRTVYTFGDVTLAPG